MANEKILVLENRATLRERHHLSKNGFLVAALSLDAHT
jgi:hypothetical protein